MKYNTLTLIVIAGILLFGSLGLSGAGRTPLLLPGDADNDGVPDAIDQCPAEDASFFDRNGDGCIDDAASARHIEFWAKGDLPFTYYINADGAPGINNGSDFTAMQSGMSAWSGIQGVTFSVTYGGTTAQQNSGALDQVNLITFKDSEYQFGTYTIAVGISTSFTVPTTYNNKSYRPGQIVDADLIFNPAMKFKTPTAGSTGTDIRSVVTHEAGHLFGISHTPVKTSTMFFVLPPGTDASSLESDDELMFFKAYGDSMTVANASRISGTVTDGKTNAPVAGAIVFAVDAASGDTATADYTLPSGSYAFPGLPDGDYYIGIHQIDTSAAIGYLMPRYVNALVETTAVLRFPPEYYDQAESSSDNPDDKTAISITAGTKVAGIDLVTNIDVTPPEVVKTTPLANASSVKIDAAIKITFSEQIDDASISKNFSLVNEATQTNIYGKGILLHDDSVLAFTPSVPFDFATNYNLTLKTGLTDRFENGLAQQYTTSFTTELMPPVAITSLAPNQGVISTVVVINGVGFSRTKTDNTVMFGSLQAEVVNAYPNRLIVLVPHTATTSDVTVQVGEHVSNAINFTILSTTEIARGFQSGIAELNARPRSITVLPEGGYAYVATDAGVAAVVVDPGIAGYLDVTSITVSGGLDATDATPDGKMVYGVSGTNEKIYAIDSDPSHGPLFNTVLAELPVGAEPLGITIDPSGGRAFVPTADGEIQIWDVRKGSETRNSQIGAIIPPDASVRGKMAVDPAGDYLLSLSGAGKLYVFDLGPDTLYATATVLSDPKDVVVDPTGQHAFVSDGTGNVSIVPLSGLFKKSYDINTGGSLLGMTVTPAGMYLYACNRQLELIDVIDLDENGENPRSLVATIPLGSNPIDIDLSPDGFYAFSVVDRDQQLIVNTIGLGPALKSLSRRAGPPGTKLVLAGNGFGGMHQETRVVFSNIFGGPPIEATPSYNSGTSLTVIVPDSAGSGPVKITVNELDPSVPQQVSNSLYFQVISFLTPPGRLRLAARAYAGIGVLPVLEFSPTGDFLVVGGETPGPRGIMGVFDTDPESIVFNQWIKTVAVSNRALSDIAITPDGERAYLLPDTAGSPILCHNVNYHSGTFGKRVSEIDLSSRGVTRFLRLGISPDGEILLASGLNAGNDSLYVIDIVPGSTNENKVVEAVGGFGGKELDVRDVAFHPAGRYAYVGLHGLAGNASIDVLCLDQTSIDYLRFVASVPLYMGDVTLIHSLAFEPDGGRCLVLMSGPFVKLYDIATIDASDPAYPSLGSPIHLPVINFPGQGAVLNVSPRGDRAIAAVSGVNNAFYSVDLTSHVDTVADAVYYNSLLTKVDMDFTPDGSRLYVAGPYQDSLFIYDFNAANRLYMRSGNEQSGIIGQPLAAPLRVWVAMSDILTVPVPGVPVTFEVTSGGGYFTDSYLTKQVVATGQDGYAELDWTLGSVVGVQTQRVAVTAEGLVGSPMQFIADSYDNPTNLPLYLAQMLPLSEATNVSVTTAVQGIFSRAIDPATISDATFYINKLSDASLVSATVGYSDGHRRVALMPMEALEYSTEYSIVTTAGITASGDGPLQDPGHSEFITAARPPLLLTSVTPPSATTGATLVLAGNGFDAVIANDKVLFNDTEAIPYDAAVDVVKVKVPADAITGTVRVVCGTDTSNAQPFVVLVPSTSPVDEVLATIGTGGSSVKSVAITPDGAVAYSVSPDGDIVIPIDVDGQTTYSSISVGDNPVAIDIHPDNTYGYVANFGSGTVSVICVNPDSVRFNKVVETINVGTSPIDVAVRPDGNRIYVANLGSSDVSIVDGDEDSEAHHQVLATIGTGGSAAKSVAITPDGTKIYVGTDAGYIVIDSKSNAVLATIGTGGSSTKSVAITPDGGLLILVTTEGTVVIYDIAPGSSTPNTVLATIGSGGSAVKSVSITPDGAVLYIILENSDKAIAYSLTVIGSAGAIAPGTPVPPSAVVLAPIDTIPTGRDPACIVFDPSGSGLALICNAGDNTITFLNASNVPAGQIKADIVLTPRTLNLRSNGRWVTGRIELPSGYWPEEIDIGSVLLQSSIHAESGNVGFEDSDQDGLRELVLKFDRAAFQAILPQGEYVPVTIAGTVRSRSFIGNDTIRTIRPVVKHPTGCALAMGESTTITWTSPAGYKVDSVSVHWTHGGTVDWFVIAHGIPDNHSLPWQVPNALYDKCRVMVTLYNKGFVVGMGMSQDGFLIGLPIAVTVGAFSGSLVAGAAVITWSTMLEQNIEGFNLRRCESEEGLYERINPRVIPSEGSASGGAYEFRDSTIALNRSYFYKLEEVSGERSKVIYGPYEVVCRAPFELAQNVPNPFNPTTSIRFTIPEDGYVMLAVYDAAGRRIRTLVDKPLKANFYRVDWNGRNDAGRQVSSGMYFYRIHAGRHTQARKMLLLR